LLRKQLLQKDLTTEAQERKMI